jgi:hypothetical protein
MIQDGQGFLTGFLGLSRSADGGGAVEVDPATEAALARSSGSPLDPALRARMEQGFGRDFSSVRVHTGAAAGEAARGVSAHAMTQGADIYFASGAYAPGTQRGDELIAHELTHVVQSGGAPPLGAAGGGAKGGPARLRRTTSDPGDPAEQQADRVARAVVAGDGAVGRGVAVSGDDAHLLRSAERFKVSFKDEAVQFGASIKGWEKAVDAAGAEAKGGSAAFASAFVAQKHDAALIDPIARDFAAMLAALKASLDFVRKELPAPLAKLVTDGEAALASPGPRVEEPKPGLRFDVKAWEALSFLYGLASLVLFVHKAKRKARSSPPRARPSTRPRRSSIRTTSRCSARRRPRPTAWSRTRRRWWCCAGATRRWRSPIAAPRWSGSSRRTRPPRAKGAAPSRPTSWAGRSSRRPRSRPTCSRDTSGR